MIEGEGEGAEEVEGEGYEIKKEKGMKRGKQKGKEQEKERENEKANVKEESRRIICGKGLGIKGVTSTFSITSHNKQTFSTSLFSFSSFFSRTSPGSVSSEKMF